MTSSSRIRDIKDCAKKVGVEIESIKQTKKHMHITLTNGRVVYASVTPSDKKRGNLEMMQDMKRIWAEGKRNETSNA